MATTNHAIYELNLTDNTIEQLEKLRDQVKAEIATAQTVLSSLTNLLSHSRKRKAEEPSPTFGFGMPLPSGPKRATFGP